MWLGFVYSRSRQALGGNKFDENGDFLVKYRDRRVRYSAPGTTMRLALPSGPALHHLHVLGPTGTGKSALLLNLICADMAAAICLS